MNRVFTSLALTLLASTAASAQPAYPDPGDIVWDNFGNDPENVLFFVDTQALEEGTPTWGNRAQQIIANDDFVITGFGTIMAPITLFEFNGDLDKLNTRHGGIWTGDVQNFFDDPFNPDVAVDDLSTPDDYSFFAISDDGRELNTYFTYFDTPDIMVSEGDEIWLSAWWTRDVPGDFTFDVPNVFTSWEGFGTDLSAVITDGGEWVNTNPVPIVVTGYVVPSPSALALLGVAGLMTPRRRRGEK